MEQILEIQLNISHFYIHLNDQTVLFLTIHFIIGQMFAQSLNIKQF